MKKAFFLSLGFLSTGLGLIGIFLPILPTVPFFLLALWSFGKSDEVWRQRLLDHPRIGPILRDYLEHRALRQGVKTRALISVWLGLVLSMILIQKLKINLMLGLIGCLVTIHILKLRVIKEDESKEVPHGR